jgi:hypothetical protein
MESLIELVAASLARHGVECPADGNSALVWKRAASPDSSVPADEATRLPEHNFRGNVGGDPAP